MLICLQVMCCQVPNYIGVHPGWLICSWLRQNFQQARCFHGFAQPTPNLRVIFFFWTGTLESSYNFGIKNKVICEINEN